MPSEIQRNPEPNRKKGPWTKLARQWDLQLMVIPAMLFIFVFSYIPMYGVLMAFQDYSLFRGFMNSPWVGFKHFVMFLRRPSFGRLCGTRW